MEGQNRHNSCLHGTYTLIRRNTLSKFNVFKKQSSMSEGTRRTKKQRIPVREAREGDSGKMAWSRQTSEGLTQVKGRGQDILEQWYTACPKPFSGILVKLIKSMYLGHGHQVEALCATGLNRSCMTLFNYTATISLGVTGSHEKLGMGLGKTGFHNCI